MTATIIQERLYRGVSPNDSYAFYHRPGYEQQPVSLTDWCVLEGAVRGPSQKFTAATHSVRLAGCQGWLPLVRTGSSTGLHLSFGSQLPLAALLPPRRYQLEDLVQQDAEKWRGKLRRKRPKL